MKTGNFTPLGFTIGALATVTGTHLIDAAQDGIAGPMPRIGVHLRTGTAGNPVASIDNLSLTLR